MRNSEYWKLRFEQLENAQNVKGKSALAEVEEQYRKAQRRLESDINCWERRFAANNGITLAQARQWLRDDALKEFKWDVKDYIKYGQENALNGKWLKELENASAKFHISRLEALKIQTQQSLEVMFAKQFKTINDIMTDAYKSGYFHTAYEVQKGFNIGWDIAGLNQSEIEKVIIKPWAADGKNFSERIWGNKDKLINEIHTELTQNIMLGKDPQKAIDAIAKKMNTSKHNAGRLIMTEEAYFSSAAQKDCFKELGVEKYKIVATLDSLTSDICQSMDGQVFDMKDYEAGTTAPPFHVNCRSVTVPYFDDDFGQIGERTARDENGKMYYIPDNINYKQWKEKFVDGGSKNELININKNDKIKNIKDVYDFDGLSNYLDLTYGIKLEDSVKQLDFSTIKSCIVGVEAVISEFPDVGNLLENATTSSLGVMSCTGNTLSFNPKNFTDKQQFLDMCEQQSAFGHWVLNSSPESIGVHEAAHGVEWALIQTNSSYVYNFQKIAAWNDCSEAKVIVSHACKNIKKTPYGKGKLKKELIQSISKYALDNDSETMAEAFADVYANGLKANPLSIEIKRLAEEQMKKYKKGI